MVLQQWILMAAGTLSTRFLMSVLANKDEMNDTIHS